MSDTTTAATVPAEKPAPVKRAKHEGPPRSFAERLTDADGNKLEFRADRKKDGSFAIYAVSKIRQEDGSVERKRGEAGEVSRFVGADAEKSARDAIASAAKVAVAEFGWKQSTRTGSVGHTATPAFTLKSLPKAASKATTPAAPVAAAKPVAAPAKK